jgi:hypothetical protein
MVVYHVMTWFDAVAHGYKYPFAVHFFARDLQKPAEYIERAREIISTFGEARHIEDFRSIYVGWERLPVEPPPRDFYIAVALPAQFIDEMHASVDISEIPSSRRELGATGSAI